MASKWRAQRIIDTSSCAASVHHLGASRERNGKRTGDQATGLLTAEDGESSGVAAISLAAGAAEMLFAAYEMASALALALASGVALAAAVTVAGGGSCWRRCSSTSSCELDQRLKITTHTRPCTVPTPRPTLCWCWRRDAGTAVERGVFVS